MKTKGKKEIAVGVLAISVIQVIGQSIGVKLTRPAMKLVGKRVDLCKSAFIGAMLSVGVYSVIINDNYNALISNLIGTFDLLLILMILGWVASRLMIKNYTKVVKLQKHAITEEKLRQYTDLAYDNIVSLWRCPEILEITTLRTDLIKHPNKFNELSQLVRNIFMDNITRVKGLEDINKKSIWLGELVACYGRELEAAQSVNKSQLFQGLHLSICYINYINVTSGRVIDIVYAMVHELAHSITDREDVADYIAMSICFISNNKLLRYCGYDMMMQRICEYRGCVGITVIPEKDYKMSLEYFPENTDWLTSDSSEKEIQLIMEG